MKHKPVATPADATDPLANYTPVALARRYDGWTGDRQRNFLSALAETGSISVACKAAGITARSAYRLRADPRGAAFAKAWDHALYVATHALTALAFERASKGGYREYWKDGKLMGETRQPSDSLLKFLLTHLAPGKFGPKGPFARLDCRVPHSSATLPKLLDGLPDTDVPIDRLTETDFNPQPRQTAHEPLIKPGGENDCWYTDD